MEAEARKRDAPKKPQLKHPEPEVISRPALMDEVPKVARMLADASISHGWNVEITYARGTTPSDRAPALVHSIAVRMRRDGQRAVAVWVAPVATGKWKFELGARLGAWKSVNPDLDGVIPIKMSASAIKTFIMTPAPVINEVISSEVWGMGEGSDAGVMEMFLSAA